MAWAGSQLPTHPLTELKEDKEDKGTITSKREEWVNTQYVNSEIGEIRIGDMKEFPPLVSMNEECVRMQEFSFMDESKEDNNFNLSYVPNEKINIEENISFSSDQEEEQEK